MKRAAVAVLIVAISLGLLGPAGAAPQGQITYAMHVTIAAAWFDPAENTGIATPFMVQEALHDALAKPMPQNAMAPSLAESWTESADGLTYEFVLRRGVIFHNGEPMTAEDVKFSFERYRGAGAKIFRGKVKAAQIVCRKAVGSSFTRPGRPCCPYTRHQHGETPSTCPMNQSTRRAPQA